MKVLDKKLIRDLFQTKGQVIAVSIVITCGIAVFVAFYSTYQNLLLSRDTYYQTYRFHDFSMSVEKAPLSSLFKIKEIEGVRALRGRIVKDISISLKGQKEVKIARVISMPENYHNVIDNIHLVSGSHLDPNSPDTCIVNDTFFKANNLSLGDRVEVTTNGKRQSMKIVGTALSPEYVYAIRNAQEIFPNPAKFAILWVSREWAESSFNLSGFYTEIVGEVYNQENLDYIFDKADKILDSYGLFEKVKKKDHISNWYLNQEIDSLKVSAQVTPVIFLGVASVILLILLSRIVQKERIQIGLLKAYGYSDLEIVTHYIKFSLIIGIGGGILGFLLGQWLGRGMIAMYVEFYSFPVLRYKFYPNLFIWSLLISCLFSISGALYAVKTIISIMPATAMRESPPKTASRTLLEKLPFFWNKLSFTNKIIIRNIWRYPLRSVFTVCGVMLSTAIVITGYFSQDAVKFMIEHQFHKTQREDVRITLYKVMGIDALYEAYRFPYVKKAEPLLLYPFEIKSDWKKKDLLITGLLKDSELFHLLDTDDKQIKSKGKGLILMDKTAEDLKLSIGDTLTIKPKISKIDHEYTVKVEQIVKQYIGAGAYMDWDELSRLLKESRALNAILLKTDSGKGSELNSYLKDIPAIASVEVKEEVLKNFDKSFGESMYIANFFLTLFSAVIAVAVIYNSSVINITERKREIASLKVLGFTDKEVGRIIFDENIFLSLIGLIFGLPFGAYLCKMMTLAYDTELFRFPFYLSNQTYIISSLTIILFVIMTNLFLRKRLAKLDMVDALKSRE